MTDNQVYILCASIFVPLMIFALGSLRGYSKTKTVLKSHSALLATHIEYMKGQFAQIRSELNDLFSHKEKCLSGKIHNYVTKETCEAKHTTPSDHN